MSFPGFMNVIQCLRAVLPFVRVVASVILYGFEHIFKRLFQGSPEKLRDDIVDLVSADSENPRVCFPVI